MKRFLKQLAGNALGLAGAGVMVAALLPVITMVPFLKTDLVTWSILTGLALVPVSVGLMVAGYRLCQPKWRRRARRLVRQND